MAFKIKECTVLRGESVVDKDGNDIDDIIVEFENGAMIDIRLFYKDHKASVAIGPVNEP